MGDKRKGEEGFGGRVGHLALFELATRQHGVVSTPQLRELGYGRSSAAKAHGVGRLRRIHRGVYAVGRDGLDWRGRCMAAVLAVYPSVASHRCAAHLWGLHAYPPQVFDLTARTQRRSRAGFRCHIAVLGAGDTSEVDRIPVTSVPRTILDLAAVLDPDRISRVVERAEELRSFDLGAVDELISRIPHHRGTAPLRAVLATYRPDPSFTRSRLERRFRSLFVEAGLPAPAMNLNIAGLEVDAYWPEERFVVELDVFETHGSRAAFERDRRRQEELMLAGIESIRITGPRLDREPDHVVERVAALLERRRRALALPPSTRSRRGGAR